MQIEGFKIEMFSALPDRLLERDRRATVSTAAKLDWVRSQIIGQYVVFNTPFGRRLLTYADHTASGRSLQFIENFIMESVLPVYGNTHTDDSFVGSITGNIMEEAQKYVKACLGGKDDDAILFCGSGSTAAIKKLQEVMGIAVSPISREHVLASLNIEQRWVVFVGPYEHHSNVLSWRNSLAEVCPCSLQLAGLSNMSELRIASKVVEIPLSERGVIDMAKLKAALENPKYKCRPKLGSFSAGSNVTGILTGTQKIARLLHAHGAFACFDFAACAPYVKIDMRSGEEDGYDAVFISPHKFMGGPCTTGVLLFNKDLYLLKSGAPSTCGGGTIDFVNFDDQKTIYLDEIERREDAGTPAIIQTIRTALAFCVKEYLTSELIASRESFFIEKAMSRLGANPNIDIYGPTTVKRIAILSFGVHANLPAKNEPETEYESSPGSSPKSNYDRAAPQELPQWQWRSRAARGSTPSRPNHKKCMNVFNMNPFKKSVLGCATSPLPRLEYRDAEIPKRETHIPTTKAPGKLLHSRFVVKLLNDLFGIQGRGGCSCAALYGHYLLGLNTEQSIAIRDGIHKGFGAIKPGWARISFGYYITHDEFDFILSAVEFIAEFGARFLPLYDLNWRTGDWTFTQDNQEIEDIIANAEKQVLGEQNLRMWNKGPQYFSPALFNNPTTLNIPSLTTDEYSSSLMAKYLKMAKYLVDRLPLHTPAREVPDGLDTALIYFMT